MHQNCTPVIATYERGQRFVCHGGFDPPHQHDHLWVTMPKGFVQPSAEDMAVLHDRLIGLFPNGGHHKWREVEATEPTTVTRITVTVPLAGEIADALAIYCERSIYNRVDFIRSLLAVVLTEPDESRALETVKAWRKDVKDKLK
jgi:hypothetical protein